VVDAEDLVGCEDIGENAVEFLGTRQVVTEWFLDDDASPRIGWLLRQARLLDLGDDRREQPRWDRQIERVVPQSSALGIQGVHGLAKAVECLRIGEVSGDEPDALAELTPDFLTEGSARMLADGIMYFLREILICPLPASETDETETWW